MKNLFQNYAYLQYLIRHKRYVYKAGRTVGVSIWQLFLHDLSKFRPSEWRPYLLWFYGQPQDHTVALKLAYDRAWNLHCHRNAHHWQHWLVVNDDGVTFTVPMPERYWREMLADWIGAGQASHQGQIVIGAWYRTHRWQIALHPTTRVRLEAEMLRRWPTQFIDGHGHCWMDDPAEEMVS